ncbi:Histidine kinase-, DNA gyrase B-, and HSP90-like ATPase [Paraburkholderia phenazinium]|uniref:Histidine kinase-, DNA gyrase B-, and HSP90-like ATPase n=2 Tax=Paraburkholderia phenazinium TaxID=60549 RepID=A0A1G8IUC8_9BURK|nr:ATP-binding protein [Paraburkholderia phenazinium]SDI22531.1 Histidine kinase-, DNA gyrase B-, and HSP90-like ATPase [Paraburkholderia phenazinium]
MLDMGLIPALERLTANFTRHTGMRCNLQVPQSEVEMTDEQAVVIFRIVQESLTNAARHSNAKRVDAVFRCEPEAFALEIKDNGIGFDVQNMRKPNTFGLVGTRERTLRAGGEMDVVSKRGRGALVRVRIPIPGGMQPPEDVDSA